MKRVILIIGCLGLLPLPALATTFIFAPASDRLVPLEWNYREVASRHWLLGCMQYDVLQGSGWFPATWYHDLALEQDGDDYSTTPQPNWYARYCGAKMDQNNSLRLEWLDPTGQAVLLRGGFAVVPDGDSPETTVVCRAGDANDNWNSLVCDAAHVTVPKNGTVLIHIAFEEAQAGQ